MDKKKAKPAPMPQVKVPKGWELGGLQNKPKLEKKDINTKSRKRNDI